MQSNQNLSLELISLEQKLTALQSRLKANLTVTDIFFNSIVSKKKKLILNLQKVVKDLHTKIPGQTLQKQIIEEINEIIPLVDTLNLTTQEDLREKITQLAGSIKKFNKHKRFKEKIITLNYGVNLFTIMDYLAMGTRGVVTCILAWNIGMSKALEHVSPIFYPINASFIAASMFVKLLITTVEFFRTRGEAKEAEMSTEQELQNAKMLLKKSTAFRFFIFTFQVLAVLGFAGVLTTPLGWVFVAAATLVGWINETFVDVKKAQAERDKYPEGSHEYVLEDTEVNKQKNEAVWKFMDVISAVLVACGPIPPVGPLLALIGLGLLAINPIREGLTYLHDKFFKEKKSEPVSTDVHDEHKYEEKAANDREFSSTFAEIQTSLSSHPLKQRMTSTPEQRITSIDELLTPEPEKKSFRQRLSSFFSGWMFTFTPSESKKMTETAESSNQSDTFTKKK